MMWRIADALKEHYVPSFIRVGMLTWIRPNLRLVTPAHPNPDHHKNQVPCSRAGNQEANRLKDRLIMRTKDSSFL